MKFENKGAQRPKAVPVMHRRGFLNAMTGAGVLLVAGGAVGLGVAANMPAPANDATWHRTLDEYTELYMQSSPRRRLVLEAALRMQVDQGYDFSRFPEDVLAEARAIFAQANTEWEARRS